MSKTRICDVCSSEITRTYVKKPHKHKAREGRDSAVIKPPLRRRILWWLTVLPLVYKVWGSSSYSAWDSYDLCASCNWNLRNTVKELAEGDTDGE